jgi:hypothetical protein
MGHYAESHILIVILNVIMMSVVMQNVEAPAKVPVTAMTGRRRINTLVPIIDITIIHNYTIIDSLDEIK